jgi:hypothetical protein
MESSRLALYLEDFIHDHTEYLSYLKGSVTRWNNYRKAFKNDKNALWWEEQYQKELKEMEKYLTEYVLMLILLNQQV